MIERVLLDAEGNELLNLWRWTREQALFVKSESLPDLSPIGTFEDVPGTGQRLFIGERRPKAGQLTLSIGTHGKSHEDTFALQRDLLRIAPLIRAYSRIPGGTLKVAGYSTLKRTFSGSPQAGGVVDLTLECASPYFWSPAQKRSVTAGANGIEVGGQARVGVMLTLTASATLTDPAIVGPMGTTTWRGTLNAGQSLTLDSREGWAVTLGGADVSLFVTGPLPYLDAGHNTLTLPAGVTGTLEFMEGEL